MIGMKYNEENLEILRNKFYNFNNLIQDDRGYIAFKVELEQQGEAKEYVFTVEEVLAMILAHARSLAEIQSKGSVRNIYLTVPTSFTMNQRRMLNDAVEMAGLTSLGMVEENVAAALTYGIDRRDENSTHSVLFLNLGSSDFEVTVANYFARQENVTDRYGNTKLGEMVENIEILSQAHSEEISGRLFNLELLNILAENFNSMKSRQGKYDIREKPKIVNRLIKEIPKIKETLSANKEKIINLPEVADYENLKMTLDRSLFEEKIEKYLVHLGTAIKEALEKAKLTAEELSEVEIIGGALRVPKVKDFLSENLGGRTLGAHINGDEAMSFGAAFLGANSSSSFVVRKIFLHRLVEEPIYLNISSENLNPGDEDYVHKRYMFFEGGSNDKKKYAVYSKDNLKAEFYTESQGVLHRVHITGVPELYESEEYKNNGTDPRIVFEATFSPNGYIEVNKVSAKIVQTYFEQVMKRVPLNKTESQEAANNTDFSASEEGQKASSEEATNTTNPEEGAFNNTVFTDANNNTYNLKMDSDFSIVFEQEARNRTRSLKLNYTEDFIGHQPMTTEQKLNATAHLVNFEKRDKLIYDTLKAKNDYEALIYSSRDWISDESHHVYSTPEIIEEFQKNLTEGEDWLYEEGFDEKLEVYQERVRGLNATISSLKYRQAEHSVRDSILEGTYKLIGNFTNEIDAFQAQFPWIEGYKIRKLKELAKNATEWFQETVKEQEKLALSEDPVLKSLDIRDKIFSISYIMEQLSKTPKPKDWDKKQKEKDLSAKNTTDTTVTPDAESSTNFNETDTEETVTQEDTDATSEDTETTEEETTEDL